MNVLGRCKSIAKRLRPPQLQLHPRFASSAPYLTPADLVNYPLTDVTTLPNGLRVATEKCPRNKSTVTVGVWIDAGSRYEPKESNGAAHFLEHLSFKGTQKRDQTAFEVEIENIGGHLNAYTSREQTVYYAQVNKRDMEQAADILSDIILNSRLSSQSVERERGVIFREMEEVYKDTEEYVFDYLHDAAYLDNPLGQTILGPKENIMKISREDVMRYIKTHYTTDRMVVCGAGAIDHEEFVRLVQEKFAAVPTEPAHPVVRVPAKFTGSDYTERQDSMDLAHIALAYETCGWTDPDTFPLLFIHAMLGTWDVNQVTGGEHMSSRLVNAVASKRLGEKVMAFNTLYNDTGLFGIYASAYEKRLYDMCQHITVCLNSLASDVTSDMVEEVRNSIVANILLNLDTSAQVCEDIGRQILTYGRRIHPTEMVARVNAVDRAAVAAAAKRFFYDKDHALAAVGPIFELQDYQWFRRRSYSLIR